MARLDPATDGEAKVGGKCKETDGENNTFKLWRRSEHLSAFFYKDIEQLATR
jgi:hypothetical protein